MRTFFENCGAYCFRFFRLLLIFAVVFIVVVLVSIAALGAVYSAFARDAISEVWPFTFGVILSLTFLFIVMLVVMMADYAKVMTVVTEAQSMLKTSWQGIKFVFRHFFSTVMLQITFVIILLAAIIGYLVVENYVGMATPFAILAMFFVQQLSVGLKILMRVAAYSGELELYWDL